MLPLLTFTFNVAASPGGGADVADVARERLWPSRRGWTCETVVIVVVFFRWQSNCLTKDADGDPERRQPAAPFGPPARAGCLRAGWLFAQTGRTLAGATGTSGGTGERRGAHAEKCYQFSKASRARAMKFSAV
ncbi:hypothetical protein N9L68_04485 [bacterium]|nr:hypothetical protein [bacterium]